MPNKYKITFNDSPSSPTERQVSGSSSEDISQDAILDKDIFTFRTSLYDKPISPIDTDIDLFASSVIYPTETYENYLNNKRIAQLDREFTPQLLRTIRDTSFEYGINSDIDTFINDLISQNSAATKLWLNNVFLKYYSNPIIIVGLLRIVARLDYEDIKPIGPTMALAALSHKDIRVKECAIRAIEVWADVTNLSNLMTLEVSLPWLQEYIHKVIEYIQKIHGSFVSSQNR